MTDQFGQDVVEAYMGHVQDNAEESVRRIVAGLRDGSCRYETDNGAVIGVEGHRGPRRPHAPSSTSRAPPRSSPATSTRPPPW